MAVVQADPRSKCLPAASAVCGGSSATRRATKYILAIVLLCTGTGWGSALGQQGTAAVFTPIPGLPSSNPAASLPHGISGDGSIVYGEVRTFAGWEAMTWTRSGGTIAHGLGFFGASSLDGGVLTGSGGRWTQASGWQVLSPPAGTTRPEALGISGDGLTIVGDARASNGNQVAVKWAGTTAGTLLPPLAGGSLQTVLATQVTNDNSLIAGFWSHGVTSAWATDGTTSWKLDSRTTGLGDLSPDGRWAVGPRGQATSMGYRLDLQTSDYLEIPNLPGRQGGTATGVSADGSVVVGYGGTVSRAYIWDAAHGTRELATVLAADGADLMGWTLTEARGISDDGRFFTGIGLNPAGVEQGWVAVIPAPATSLIAVAMSAVIGVRRRRS